VIAVVRPGNFVDDEVGKDAAQYLRRAKHDEGIL
jgi:hypothetical protein